MKRRRRTKTPRQLALPIRSHGGARKGAGRKRRAPRPRVVHRTRPKLDRNHPVHVTIRVRAGVPRLRTRAPMRTILRVFRAARGRFGLRVVQFAVLGDHLHLIVEAEGRESLTRGMRGLGTRLAIHLNRTFGRKGQGARRSLPRTRAREPPRGPARALLRAAELPQARGPKRPGDRSAMDLGTLPARTWLLAIGWRRHGRIDRAEIPGAAPPQIPSSFITRRSTPA